MNEYLLLKLLHLILFVYWLGGDLGTFYASRYVVKTDLTPAQRHTALNIMMGVDQGPRICMALILGPGVHMAAMTGLIQVSGLQLTALWLVCLLWVSMVLVIHFGHGKAFIKPLTQFDFGFRLAVIALCIYIGATSLAGAGKIQVDWLAWKLLIFAAMVACGLGIRLQLKPFIQGFGQMMQQGASEQSDKLMLTGLQRVRPFVYLIWVGLIVNAAFGLHLIQ
ncbi:hypothetical protein [Paraferrimonas sedimenticola]|uniref:Uncharacterized protein n=1 Tax=Paraferrimonas sedimenticola TaxID=375674 RepID=A0AA37RWU4_9GAMM|nr:hypothetical protein [Paraferrimonas sedimenticola]GLP96419.1 hypothetical protein GCM10007895_17250 [Paraferrimonas sedimenticola]